jgi:hypothetical protein
MQGPWRTDRSAPGHLRWPCLAICLLLQALPRAGCFEVFSQQQIVALNDPNKIVNYNNSEHGSTHVDDYWAKIDIAYSPLEGSYVFKHVRIGCYTVMWQDAPDAFVEYVTINEVDCVRLCNRTQTYFQSPDGCRCGLNETALVMYEQLGNCPEDGWEVYREFDYRSSMSPSTYDVMQRPPLLYQIVTLRVPHVTPSLRYYIHAVNVLEQLPAFRFDTRLERMIFNAVWDFHPTRSRMVGLSFAEWDPNAELDFTFVSFNTSTGFLVVNQEHTPIQTEITGKLPGSEASYFNMGLASCDGMGTVDILFGTYYTVVPAQLSEQPQVVHVVVAVDIAGRVVLHAAVLQATLMNLQVNSLNHTLYGAGADLSEQFSYYQICEAKNESKVVADVVAEVIVVNCALKALSPLPEGVNQMYLQSAAMDHKFNYAWFTYKEEPTGST